MNYEEIVVKNLEIFNDSIRHTIIRKGISNTGGAAKSLHVTTDKSNEKAYSVGADYIEVLDQGRAPGTYAPMQPIFEWVKSKLGN